MAKNADYYTQVHNYVKQLGMDRVDAEQIATTLSVLIPMRPTFGNEENDFAENNQHVVENIKKLHQGKPYFRIWPRELKLPAIMVESYNELPSATTYGQQYIISLEGTRLETRENGLTEVVKYVSHLEISEPLGFDPAQLALLQEKAEQRGIQIVVTNRQADDAFNIIGLEKLRTILAESTEQSERQELAQLRDEDRAGWYQPKQKLTFPNHPIVPRTRIRHRARGG
jgi:hypothetical protein